MQQLARSLLVGKDPLRRCRKMKSACSDRSSLASACPARCGWTFECFGQSHQHGLIAALWCSIRVSLRDAAALVRTRAQRRGFLRTSDTHDEAEMTLLTTLEDLGQKAFVLSEFADSKLAHFYPDGPHQLSQDLDASATTGVSPGRTSVQGSARRVSSISSSSSSALDPIAAEAAAAEALMLYVRSLAFLQRAIGLTKKYIDSRSRPGVPAVTSAELNEVVQWLRARFNEVYDKADFARSRCNELPESAQQVDKLIFDKAVEVARAAATDELENNREGCGWDPSHCLLAYETASSMLSSLLDPGEEALSLSEGSILMIDKYVKSINKRLTSLQEQFGWCERRAPQEGSVRWLGRGQSKPDRVTFVEPVARRCPRTMIRAAILYE